MREQDSQPTPVPTGIKLHKKSRYLEIIYGNGDVYKLPFEHLRVFSPSVEDKANRPLGRSVSRNKVVNISAINPVGSYALQIVFDDGHETGIYSWARLYDMVVNMKHNWEDREATELAGKREDVQHTSERTITILYFGALANRLGLDNETITLPAEVITIGELIPWLMTRRGEWKKALAENLKITVNRRSVGLRDNIRDEDEIALALVAEENIH